MSTIQSQLNNQGFALLSGALSQSNVESLRKTLAPLMGAKHGARNLFRDLPAVMEIILPLLSITVSPLFKAPAFTVKSTYFDKPKEANWLVPWHQDTTVAVKENKQVVGFGTWSTKAGVPHVEAPEQVLATLITARVHLDDAGSENGALRVLPGTQLRGPMSSQAILDCVEHRDPVTVEAMAGDVRLMSPLLAHSSRKSANPKHRRIIHVECACEELPEQLCWHEKNGF